MESYEDKRRYIRYEVLDYASVRIEGVEEPINVVIADIGLGGLQMRSKTTFDAGATIDISVGREAGTLTLHCEVRHCASIVDSPLHGIGVRFMPRNHEERMAIAEYVHGIFQRQCDLLTL